MWQLHLTINRAWFVTLTCHLCAWRVSKTHISWLLWHAIDVVKDPARVERLPGWQHGAMYAFTSQNNNWMRHFTENIKPIFCLMETRKPFRHKVNVKNLHFICNIKYECTAIQTVWLVPWPMWSWQYISWRGWLPETFDFFLRRAFLLQVSGDDKWNSVVLTFHSSWI